MISSATLYYFFSTLAQVVAAATALIAVLVHFRISALRDFLIGDGESILMRKNKAEPGYELLSEKNRDRLQNAVDRKDIFSIKEILTELGNLEKDKNVNKEHHGFQWLSNYFYNTEKQLNEMSKSSKYAFIFALLTSLYSIFAILFIDLSMNSLSFQFILIIPNIILLAICGYFVLKGIGLAFKNFTNRFE